jgi:hypothetical protein
MIIRLEAELMDRNMAPQISPSMYMPGYCAMRLKVVLGRRGGQAHEFRGETTVQLDEVQSVFDHVMRNLTRNMKEILDAYLRNKSFLEKVPLMPTMTFERMEP